MKNCPKCSSSSFKRVPRPFLIKIIPGSKRYKCANCKSKFTWISFLNMSF